VDSFANERSTARDARLIYLLDTKDDKFDLTDNIFVPSLVTKLIRKKILIYYKNLFVFIIN